MKTPPRIIRILTASGGAIWGIQQLLSLLLLALPPALTLLASGVTSVEWLVGGQALPEVLLDVLRRREFRVAVTATLC